MAIKTYEVSVKGKVGDLDTTETYSKLNKKSAMEFINKNILQWSREGKSVSLNVLTSK